MPASPQAHPGFATRFSRKSFDRIRPAPLLFAAALAAGCGGIAPQANPAAAHAGLSGAPSSSPQTSQREPTPEASQYFSLYPARSRIDTNQSDLIQALYPNGEAAAVGWSIADGENRADLGQGSISAAGKYTPPPVLSADSVRIEVKAALKKNPAIVATYILTVTPGMVQALTPEVANLAPGNQLQVTGEIAEVNGGAVDWRLSADASNERPLTEAFGTVRSSGCRRSHASYTVCTAIYTAPASLPAGARPFYLTATPRNGSGAPATVHILLNDEKFQSSPLGHQHAETGSVRMGTSGGNANDFDSSRDSSGHQYVDDCCGGTLGALVQDQDGALYILSDNHVLAESDHAQPGDSIVQPALIDSNCNPQAGRTVGALRYTVPLNRPDTNVDAALALATPAVDPSGAILEIGATEDGALGAAPPAGGKGEALTAGILNRLKVVKSGRTTGLTCSTVGVVDLTIAIDYYYDCAETKPYYTKIFTSQIGVPGFDFADSGDSGALVLDQSNAEPIGLLLATGGGAGTGMSVASPIRDVLSELSRKSQAAGREFSIVGGPQHPVTCSDFGPSTGTVSNVPLTAAGRRRAEAAAAQAEALWMTSGSGILGVGAGSSLDRPGEPAVVIWVDRAEHNLHLPDSIAGLRTVVIRTDRAGAEAHVPQEPFQGIHLPGAALQEAAAVVRERAARLMQDPAFFGVGVTESYDDPTEASLLVFTDVNKTPKAMPDFVGGLRVRYLTIHRLHVTRSRFRPAHRPSACELRPGENRWTLGRNPAPASLTHPGARESSMTLNLRSTSPLQHSGGADPPIE